MIEFIKVRGGYEDKVILKDISFKVNGTEFIGIIGPNGSGKTTLLRSLSRTIDIFNGEILYDKKNIDSFGLKDIAKNIAVVSQDSDFSFDMTVEEYVLLGRTPHFSKWQFMETESDYGIAHESMKLTDTYALKDRLVKDLSGGEKQLVVIARALTQNPKLLLLDEPTNHLDIGHQGKILDLINHLNKDKGLAVIIVMHDLNLASEYCDKILLMNNGKVHKFGSPKEVLTYETIEEVYNTVVIVDKSPLSLNPHIYLAPKKVRLKNSINCR